VTIVQLIGTNGCSKDDQDEFFQASQNLRQITKQLVPVTQLAESRSSLLLPPSPTLSPQPPSIPAPLPSSLQIAQPDKRPPFVGEAEVLAQMRAVMDSRDAGNSSVVDGASPICPLPRSPTVSVAYNSKTYCASFFFFFFLSLSDISVLHPGFNARVDSGQRRHGKVAATAPVAVFL